MTTEKVLLSAFVAVEGAHAFSAFCPSLFTIKTFADSEEKKRAVRIGYIPATAFAIGMGIIVSLLIKSKLPLVIAVGTSLFMVATYEVAMR